MIATGLALFASNVLAGDIILSRQFPSCGFVGGQIYCYGGDTSTTIASNAGAMDENIYSLNIVQFSGQPTDSMSNKWETVKPNAPFAVGVRRAPAAIVLPDKKRFLIHGGWNVNPFKYANQTIIYDTVSNTWQSGASYNEVDRGVRQTYFASAVLLPNNQIGFYGGLEQLANISAPRITATGENMPYDINNGSRVGFDKLQMYSPDAATWAPFNPQINAPANYYPNSQTATLDSVSGKVYYLGGSFYTPKEPTYSTRIAFSWAYTFNTKSGTWLNETLGGEIPSNRIYHTADLLPNSRDIIVYGGTNDGAKASVDYCYTLNLVDNTWVKQNNVNVPTTLSGPRFTHASVLVNTTLFILFGKGLNGDLNPSLLSIDIANVANISYTAIFNAPSGAVVPPTNNNTTTSPSDPESSGLSKGAIGGIAAGIVVAVLAIIAGVIFCIRKRKAEKNKQNEAEQLSVDWDKIEDQYREIPATNSNITNSPHSANSVDNQTRVANSTPEMASTLRSQYTPNLLSSNFIDESKLSFENEKGHGHFQSPNAVDVSVVKPSVDSTDRGYTVVKPDAN